MHKIRTLMSAVLATSIVFAFSESFGQQAQEGQEVPEDRRLQERQQVLTPLPMFVNGTPLEEFVADEARVREALEGLQGIAAIGDEELVRQLQAIEAGDAALDEVPEELRGISGLLTQFMLRSWLLNEYYLFAGKIRDYMYIDEENDGEAGSGHLAVDMKYWRYNSVADFRAGLPPDKIELLHWHIEVDKAYNVHPRQNVYDEPFPQIDLTLPQEAIDSIWHPARDLRWKLHARGRGIIIRQVYRKVDDNPIELLPPTDPVYGSTDETCIDILFNPYPPELELPPQLGYCLGRCEHPYIINTGG